MGAVVRFDHKREAAYMEWSRHAECAGGRDLFYPGPGDSQAEAKTICRTCPVQHECLTYALEKPEPYGIWGGLSERERKRIREHRRAS